ncbi:GDSL-type esterase/lipase family protein [Gordonia polyisoprenivorans]|uniref:GDSL-type esterase/lipase family protein n=1 Tax=Gordonia polyisoprenivorans TaxID=84595 RepID=UPI00223493B0|nr:GDSL-type esterase/lipase family protein [Gordonia polyisoprenivorans]
MRRPTGRARRGAVAIVVAAVLATAGVGVVQAHPSDRGPGVGAHWVAGWMAAPSNRGDISLENPIPSAPADHTLRVMTTPHLSGSVARVRLTNRFGAKPIRIGGVTVSRRVRGAQVARIVPVTFGGRDSVSIAPGADVASDPVDVDVTAWRALAVSVFLPDATVPTVHYVGNATSFATVAGSGDHSRDTSGAAFTVPTDQVPLVTGIDVAAPTSVTGIVAVGDSITDGFTAAQYLGLTEDRSVIDTNVRYPDFLQRRLDRAGIDRPVLNAGISGNRVTLGPAIFAYGPSLMDRVADDVIGVPGVRDVILLEGINDLGIPPGTDAATVIDGLRKVILRLHAAGLRVHLGTLLPAATSLSDGWSTPAANGQRLVVNAWIRRQHLSDSVIDFESAMRDPHDPNGLNPRLSGPDLLHPNAAGYSTMAAQVDLATLAS